MPAHRHFPRRSFSAPVAAAMATMVASAAAYAAEGAPAGPQPSAPAAHACAAPAFRQFDFWLGDWDAFEADDDKTAIARTHVDPIAGGCAIHELYEQSDGLVGDSILSFDGVRSAWQQTWVTNRGSFMAIAGRLVDGVLALEGEMHTADGRTIRQRITWKREGEAVRESSTMSRDDGRTWEPAFDVRFRRHR